MLIFVDGISTDHLEIAQLMGRNTKLDTLSMDDHIEIAWSISKAKFRKLAGRLGLSDEDLECIACDVQFLEDSTDK